MQISSSVLCSEFSHLPVAMPSSLYAAPQASASNGVGNGDGMPHVLVVPYPAQGHMLPLLDLTALLAARGLALTVAVTAGNVRLLAPFLAACPSVATVVLPFPSSPFLPAGCSENTKDLPADLFRPFMASLAALSAPLLSWCKSQPRGVTAIVSDLFTGWTLPLAEELGVPHVAFSCANVHYLATTHSLWRRMPTRRHLDDADETVTFSEVPGSPSFPWRRQPAVDVQGACARRRGVGDDPADLPVEYRELLLRGKLVRGARGRLRGAPAPRPDGETGVRGGRAVGRRAQLRRTWWEAGGGPGEGGRVAGRVRRRLRRVRLLRVAAGAVAGAGGLRGRRSGAELGGFRLGGEERHRRAGGVRGRSHRGVTGHGDPRVGAAGGDPAPPRRGVVPHALRVELGARGNRGGRGEAHVADGRRPVHQRVGACGGRRGGAGGGGRRHRARRCKDGERHGCSCREGGGVRERACGGARPEGGRRGGGGRNLAH
ncbi:hypothetical protein ACQJBY_008648 [Aegilops geniculata]